MKPFTLQQAIIECAVAIGIGLVAVLAFTGCATTGALEAIHMQQRCARGAVRDVCVNPHTQVAYSCYVCAEGDVREGGK